MGIFLEPSHYSQANQKELTNFKTFTTDGNCHRNLHPPHSF